MKKIYKKLTKEQKARGVIFSSCLNTEGTVTLEWDIFETDKSPTMNGRRINYTTFLKTCKQILNELEHHNKTATQDSFSLSFTDFLEDWNESIKYLLRFYQHNHFVRTWKYKTGIWTHSRYAVLTNLHFQLHIALEIEKQRKQEV